MAYFFISNNVHFYNATKVNLRKTDFKVSFDYQQKDIIYALATHKLAFENNNSAQLDSDFCIVTGTCIYKESLNYEMLLEDFCGDLSLIRENSIGQYAVAIRKDNNLTVFGDACGCYNIYYWHGDDGSWIISSSLFHMAEVLKDNITLDNFAIAERSFYKVLLNGRTFFKEIHRLRGTEFLNVKLDSPIFKKKNTKVDFPVGSFEEMVDRAADSYRNNARIVAKVLGTPKICATGGLDSRIILAAFLSVGIKPVLFYGVGNNIITAPKNEDIIILKKMNKTLDLKLETGDFSVSDPLDKDWNYYIQTHGFRTAYMWGAQQNVINSLAHGQHLLMFGWGGEYLRRSWYHLYDSPTPSVDELLRKWHQMPKFEGLKKDIPNHEALVKEHFIEECKYLGIDPNNTSEDDLYLLEIAWGAQADTQIPSFMQHYNYCYLMSFEYNLQRYRVTTTEKENAKFMLAILYKLYPDLLKEPIFTHEQWMKLDIKHMKLIPYLSFFDKLYKTKSVQIARKITPPIIRRWGIHPIIAILQSLFSKKIETERPDFIIDAINTDVENTRVKISNIYDNNDKSQYTILIRALDSI